jgi:hypothetical protein
MTGKAIYKLLSTNANVTAIVSTRIYPDMATQDAAYPFIVYSHENTTPTDTKDGASPMDAENFEIRVFAKSYSVAQDIAVKVRNALDQFKGTSEGIKISQIIFENQQSIDMDFDNHIYAIIQGYIIRVNR